MNWALLLSGFGMIIVGGFIIWRFRQSRFMTDLPSGCAMSLGVLLLICGICCIPFGL